MTALLRGETNCDSEHTQLIEAGKVLLEKGHLRLQGRNHPRVAFLPRLAETDPDPYPPGLTLGIVMKNRRGRERGKEERNNRIP